MKLRRPLLALLAAALLALTFAAGRACGPEASEHADHRAQNAPATPQVWTCAMHPSVRLPGPGQCPICFMDLIPANSGGGEDDLGPRTLRLTEAARKLAEIETAPVRRMSVAHDVSMVGKVAFDETRLAYLTAWVGGRLDRLFVDYTGVNVRRGDHMVEIYSPTLYSAQQELLQAIATAERLDRGSLDVLRSTGQATVRAAREKLRLYGVTEQQIAEIEQRGTPDEHVVLLAPAQGVVVHKNAVEGMYVEQGARVYTIADLSRVWVLLDAYESDLAWLRYGQDVEFRVQAFPGEAFHGRIAFIDPVLNDRTRTVKVRLGFDNSELRLKPDMFVSAQVSAVLTPGGKVVDEELAGRFMCPMHPEVIGDDASACPECGMDLVPATELGFAAPPASGPSLVIPATAPLVTGKRAVVYVRVPDQDAPTYEGREIALGPRAGEYYVVRDGLAEGEEVVVRGNFKLDSELQIRAKPSMMSADPSEAKTARSEAPPELVAGLGEVTDAYLRLQDALARDTDDPAAARAIVDALAAIDAGPPGGAARDAWSLRVPDLRAAAEAVATAADLAERREHIAPLTEQLVAALDAFGYAREDGDVGLYHCPMALGTGADWLQAGDDVRNPYYGAEMLRCGDRVRLVPRER